MAETKVGAKTIEPVRKQALGVVPPPVSTTPAPDPAESWMAEHPEGKDFRAALEPTITTDTGAPPSTAPAVEQTATPPSSAPSSDAPVKAETPPPATVQKTDAPAEPTTQTPPAQPTATQPAQPIAAETIRVASDGKYVLAEGAEPWTGEQIVMALRERNQALPRVKVADGFEFLFGMPLEQAEQQWKPVLQALWDNRERQPLINDLLFNCSTEKFDYFLRCSQQYDSEVPPSTQPRAAQPAQPAHVALPPEAQQQINELTAWRQKQEKQNAKDRVNRELADAISKYPFLATDERLRDELILTAKMMNAQDERLGLPEAVAAKASIYDAILVHRSSQPAAATTVAQPATVPALNGSPGASPTGTRPNPTNKPKSFGDLESATDDWLANESKNY